MTQSGAMRRFDGQPDPNLLPVFAYYDSEVPLTGIDEIDRLSAWPQGSCTFGWYKAGDGSWVCWSTGVIFGGRYHGKYLTGYFTRAPAVHTPTVRLWSCEWQVASTRKLAKERAERFWRKHVKKVKRRKK